MKMKNILLFSLLCLAVACADKKEVAEGSKIEQQALLYSVKDGTKSLASSAKLIALSATRAEVGTIKEFQFMAALAKPNTNSSPTSFTISAAPEEVGRYNQKFGTNYPTLPDSLVTLTDKLIIDSALLSSNVGKLDVKISDSLKNNQPYLFAIKITPSDNGIPIIPGGQILIYQIQKTVPVVNTSLSLTRDLYLRLENTGSSVADIGTTFTMEALVYMERFRDASDVGDAQISTLMGTEGKTLMRFGDAGINGNQLQVNGSTIMTFATKQWYHVAAVISGNTTSVYVNGKLTSSFNSSGSLDEFYIGKSYNDNRGMWGRVAEVRLWKIARSEADIKENMLGVGSSSSGLYAYWKMSSIKDNKIPDETGNGKDLSLWGQGSDKSQKTINLYTEPTNVTIQ